ncbi:UBX domain-containing protein [Apiospora arundinis]
MAQEGIGEQEAWLAKDKAIVAAASPSKPAISAKDKLQTGYYGGLVTAKGHRSRDSRIVQILEANVQGAYVINILKGARSGERVIDLMSKENCAQGHSDLFESAKNGLLPEEFRTNTIFDFRGGELVYLAESNASKALVP